MPLIHVIKSWKCHVKILKFDSSDAVGTLPSFTQMTHRQTVPIFDPYVVPYAPMGLLPVMSNYGLRMRRECRERFPRHWLQRKLLVSDPGMDYGTCVTHVPWCMSGSLTRGGGENVPGIPGACGTRNFAYQARGPCTWTHLGPHTDRIWVQYVYLECGIL